MSLLLNGTSQYLSLASALATAEPLSFACWFKPASVLAAHVLLSIGASTGTARWQLVENHVSGFQCQMTSLDSGGSSGSANATGSSPSGAWHFFAGRVSTSSSRKSWYDSATGTETTNIPVSGANRSLIGARLSGGTAGAFAAGRLAHVAFWSVAISDANATSLIAGALPSTIQAGSLLAYLPLTTDFTDTIGNTWTNNGTATIDADNPTMASDGQPTRKRFGGVAFAGASVNPFGTGRIW